MKKKIKIIISGAESTGKSTLSRQLADYYNTLWLPEYARKYVEELDRPYTYEDVVIIAKKQIDLEKNYMNRVNNVLFVDTGLIITKIWFEFVFGRIPSWIDNEISANKPDLYLLCDNDIAWQADKVRENGGEMRNILFEKYKEEIEKINCKYSIISGKANDRLQNALKIVKPLIRVCL